jgi:hypothetical protein
MRIDRVERWFSSRRPLHIAPINLLVTRERKVADFFYGSKSSQALRLLPGRTCAVAVGSKQGVSFSLASIVSLA